MAIVLALFFAVGSATGLAAEDPVPKCGRQAVVIDKMIHFESGQSSVPRDFIPMLDDVAAIMKNNPTMTVAVWGFADSQEAPRSDKKLSRKRAEAVRLYLLGKGIPNASLSAVGKGSGYPIAGDDTAEGRSKNRRVEFVVTRQPLENA